MTGGSGQERAADINVAFSDPEVSVVLCAIGGNHSNQVVDHLDDDLIRSNPKVFQRYSDITTLYRAALAKHAGLRTFHVPGTGRRAGRVPQVFPYTDRFLRAAWFDNTPLRFEPADTWTDEFLDWFKKGRSEARQTAAAQFRMGERPIRRRGGAAHGWQPGAICWHPKGSPDGIDLDCALLVLETSETVPTNISSPAFIDSHLTDLRRLGVFDRIAGLVVARPYGYAEQELDQVWDLVASHTAESSVPVLANVEAGKQTRC